MPCTPTSLSIDRANKAVGINSSRAAEARIAEEVRHAEAEQWQPENMAAINA